MPNNLMTVSQAAEYLKVCDKTIRRLIAKQELTASKVGNSWRIQRGDIDKYLSKNSNLVK